MVEWRVSARLQTYNMDTSSSRYTEGGTKCIVRGPIVQPRNEDSEQTYIMPIGQILLGVGIPVVVTGLKYATALNGKVGDLRSWVEEAGCFMVHFEDERLEPRPVRQEYLKIVFELPELEGATDSTAGSEAVGGCLRQDSSCGSPGLMQNNENGMLINSEGRSGS